MDAVAADGKLLIYAVSQHIEDAGVHSGDATLVLPPIYQDEAPSSTWKGKPVGIKGLTPQMIKDSKLIAEKVAKAFNITGPFNMQIILSRDPNDPNTYTLKVIECNIRASRSFPFVSKVLDINFIDVATRALVNDPSLASSLPKKDLMLKYLPYKCVKNPIFSWTRLAGADPMLGVEMASTGEVACFGRDLNEAMFTSLFSNHNNFKQLPMTKGSSVLMSLDSLTDPCEAAYTASELLKMGYKVIVDDELTATVLADQGVSGIQLFSEKPLAKLLASRTQTKKLFQEYDIQMMISLCKTRPRNPTDVKYLMRRTNIDLGLGFINDSKNAILFVDALKQYVSGDRLKVEAVKSAKEWRS